MVVPVIVVSVVEAPVVEEPVEAPVVEESVLAVTVPVVEPEEPPVAVEELGP